MNLFNGDEDENMKKKIRENDRITVGQMASDTHWTLPHAAIITTMIMIIIIILIIRYYFP